MCFHCFFACIDRNEFRMCQQIRIELKSKKDKLFCFQDLISSLNFIVFQVAMSSGGCGFAFILQTCMYIPWFCISTHDYFHMKRKQYYKYHFKPIQDCTKVISFISLPLQGKRANKFC